MANEADTTITIGADISSFLKTIEKVKKQGEDLNKKTFGAKISSDFKTNADKSSSSFLKTLNNFKQKSTSFKEKISTGFSNTFNKLKEKQPIQKDTSQTVEIVKAVETDKPKKEPTKPKKITVPVVADVSNFKKELDRLKKQNNSLTVKTSILTNPIQNQTLPSLPNNNLVPKFQGNIYEGEIVGQTKKTGSNQKHPLMNSLQTIIKTLKGILKQNKTLNSKIKKGFGIGMGTGGVVSNSLGGGGSVAKKITGKSRNALNSLIIDGIFKGGLGRASLRSLGAIGGAILPIIGAMKKFADKAPTNTELTANNIDKRDFEKLNKKLQVFGGQNNQDAMDFFLQSKSLRTGYKFGEFPEEITKAFLNYGKEDTKLDDYKKFIESMRNAKTSDDFLKIAFDLKTVGKTIADSRNLIQKTFNNAALTRLVTETSKKSFDNTKMDKEASLADPKTQKALNGLTNLITQVKTRLGDVATKTAVSFYNGFLKAAEIFKKIQALGPWGIIEKIGYALNWFVDKLPAIFSAIKNFVKQVLSLFTFKSIKKGANFLIDIVSNTFKSLKKGYQSFGAEKIKEIKEEDKKVQNTPYTKQAKEIGDSKNPTQQTAAMDNLLNSITDFKQKTSIEQKQQNTTINNTSYAAAAKPTNGKELQNNTSSTDKLTNAVQMLTQVLQSNQNQFNLQPANNMNSGSSVNSMAFAAGHLLNPNNRNV